MIFKVFIYFSNTDIMMEPKYFFLYPGIILNIGGIFLFIIFGLIPIYLTKNEIFINIMRKITKYTGGIYYLHWFVKILFIKKRTTFLGCITIYIFCYFICSIGNYIFGKTKFKFLFN